MQWGVQVAKRYSDKVEKQIDKAGLPTTGTFPFEPKIEKNKVGEKIIAKSVIIHGPKKGKRGYLDILGRIWIKDRAHGDDPDHWDIQEDGGKSYFRVDLHGNLLK